MPHKPNHSDSFLDAVGKGLAGTAPLLHPALRATKRVDEIIERAAKPLPSSRKKKKLKAKPDPDARKPENGVRYVEPTAEPVEEPLEKPPFLQPLPEPAQALPVAPRNMPKSDLSRPWWAESGAPAVTPDDPFADTSPYGGGGQLDPRDPTSFAAQPEEYETPWTKRERDIAARAMLRRQLKAEQVRRGGNVGP